MEHETKQLIEKVTSTGYDRDKLLSEMYMKVIEIVDTLGEVKEQTTKTNGRVNKHDVDIEQLKSSQKFKTWAVSGACSVFVIILGVITTISGSKIQESIDFVASQGQKIKDATDESIKAAIHDHEIRDAQIVDYRITLYVQSHKNEQLIQNKQTKPLPNP